MSSTLTSYSLLHQPGFIGTVKAQHLSLKHGVLHPPTAVLRALHIEVIVTLPTPSLQMSSSFSSGVATTLISPFSLHFTTYFPEVSVCQSTYISIYLSSVIIYLPSIIHPLTNPSIISLSIHPSIHPTSIILASI